jgi:hypothetical protein
MNIRQKENPEYDNYHTNDTAMAAEQVAATRPTANRKGKQEGSASPSNAAQTATPSDSLAG